MNLMAFSSRTAKEILRDRLNLLFGLGFPLVLLGLLSLIQANIPVSMFELSHLTPGITVFGLSFMTLFSAVLLAKDRKNALLQRLYTTPLSAGDFIFGYMLPVLPMAIAQSVICYAAAVVLGLEIKITILYAVLFVFPIALFYIALGLICGSVLNSKQVGGICGALLTNLSAWLSGLCRVPALHPRGRAGTFRACRQFCRYFPAPLVGARLYAHHRQRRCYFIPAADETKLTKRLKVLCRLRNDLRSRKLHLSRPVFRFLQA